MKKHQIEQQLHQINTASDLLVMATDAIETDDPYALVKLWKAIECVAFAAHNQARDIEQADIDMRCEPMRTQARTLQ